MPICVYARWGTMPMRQTMRISRVIAVILGTKHTMDQNRPLCRNVMESQDTHTEPFAVRCD